MLASIPGCAAHPLCVGNKCQMAVGTLLPRCATSGAWLCGMWVLVHVLGSVLVNQARLFPPHSCCQWLMGEIKRVG